MTGETPGQRLRTNATSIASVAVTGFWMAALFTGQDWWLAALLVGYVAVIPVVAMLFGDEADVAEWWDEDEVDLDAIGGRDDTDATAGGNTDDGEPALDRLRRRYAEGELTDEQFERKLQLLLETETLEDVEERAARREREQLRER